MYPVVYTLEHPNHRHRVAIFRRDDGSFGFWAFAWADDVNGWDLLSGYSEMRTDTLARALTEVRGRIAWLSDVQPNEELKPTATPSSLVE